jgi:hypothetical protein
VNDPGVDTTGTGHDNGPAIQAVRASMAALIDLPPENESSPNVSAWPH